jgi:quercetin dioxygenase-like cupin family protein
MNKLSTILSLAAVLFLACACGQTPTQQDPQLPDTETMTQQSDNFIFAAETPWQDAGGGAERQILGYNDDIMMVKVSFKKGQVGAMHSHPHSQVTYVASGKFEFTVGDVTKIVEAGDALYKQPNIIHGCTCLEDGILIDCFNPMRETFLK